MGKIILLCGTAQRPGYTLLASRVAEAHFKKDWDTRLYTPRDLPLVVPGMDGANHPDLKAFAEDVATASGLLLATPEYHGSYSSGIKLLIDNLGFPSALKGKPVVLLGVAAGRIGAIKSLEHLSSVCLHVGALVLPGSLSLANVRAELDAEGKSVQPATQELIEKLADRLSEYIHKHICPLASQEALARLSQTKK